MYSSEVGHGNVLKGPGLSQETCLGLPRSRVRTGRGLNSEHGDAKESGDSVRGRQARRLLGALETLWGAQKGINPPFLSPKKNLGSNPIKEYKIFLKVDSQ